MHDDIVKLAKNVFLINLDKLVSQKLCEYLKFGAFTKLEVAVARVAQQAGSSLRDTLAEIFHKNENDILYSERKLVNFILSRCLTLCEDPTDETFLLICSFMHEVAVYWFSYRQCYRILDLCSICLLSIISRHFRQYVIEPLTTLWSLCDHLCICLDREQGKAAKEGLAEVPAFEFIKKAADFNSESRFEFTPEEETIFSRHVRDFEANISSKSLATTDEDGTAGIKASTSEKKTVSEDAVTEKTKSCDTLESPNASPNSRKNLSETSKPLQNISYRMKPIYSSEINSPTSEDLNSSNSAQNSPAEDRSQNSHEPGPFAVDESRFLKAGPLSTNIQRFPASRQSPANEQRTSPATFRDPFVAPELQFYGPEFLRTNHTSAAPPFITTGQSIMYNPNFSFENLRAALPVITSYHPRLNTLYPTSNSYSTPNLSLSYRPPPAHTQNFSLLPSYRPNFNPSPEMSRVDLTDRNQPSSYYPAPSAPQPPPPAHKHNLNLPPSYRPNFYPSLEMSRVHLTDTNQSSSYCPARQHPPLARTQNLNLPPPYRPTFSRSLEMSRVHLTDTNQPSSYCPTPMPLNILRPHTHRI
ncbi:hypothetical protein CDAR_407431 [Caerostris darwini]|uniref:Uncharacterized protein n=1 Tax=Caerostris darwini TaxID=1538125 RepID=A0AAV4Q384_9ARAC|nr:hypothetical protein CDAR_407431 [Caerostris darwini]